jgi:hypothetical protein
MPVGGGTGFNAQPSSYRPIIDAFVQRQKQGTGGRITINLGIDLGTSYTKVVWRDARMETSYALKLNSSGQGIEAFLLPSRVSIDGTVFSWGPAADGAISQVEHFKMCLACAATPESACGPAQCPLTEWAAFLRLPCGTGGPVDLVAAYFLANVIAESRRQISDLLRSRRISAPIHWSANLAVPVKQMDENGVAERFQTALNAAWLMAAVFEAEPGLSEFSAIQRCYEDALAAATDERLDCFVYPEVGAEVASATLSRSARDGLYVFVDIGAGTIDASVFRLYSPEGEPGQHIYDAEVVKLGAAHLEAAAAQKLARASKAVFRNLKEGKIEAKGAGGTLASQSQGCYAETIEQVRNITVDSLVPLLRRAFAKEERRRAWRSVYLMLGGGGANLEVYQSAARDVFGRLAQELEAQILPVPADFDLNGLPPAEFHRLAVAYGLSIEFVSLPEIALPRDVEPLNLQRAAAGLPEMVTKDMV